MVYMAGIFPTEAFLKLFSKALLLAERLPKDTFKREV